MKWTVIYRPDAADDLATIWLNSSNLQAVTAANSVDIQLDTDPLSAGESREGNSRVLYEDPLVLYFDVDEQDCTATIWGVVHRQ